MGNTIWRAEPISVEKLLDELRVGVKGQSNLEIARTPRNAFRCSLGSFRREVEHRLSSLDKLRMRAALIPGVRAWVLRSMS